MAAAGTKRRGRAVIVGGVRTPFAKAGGSLEPLGAADLGRHVLVEALARTAVAGSDIDHVVLGCGGSPSDSANVARVAALRAGLPETVPALTVQRNCASGMEAVIQAATLIETGRATVVACGGTESMSNYPLELPRSFRQAMMRLGKARGPLARVRALAAFRPRDLRAESALMKGLTDPTCGLSMGQTAEVLARELGISRERQDAFALQSHQRAAAAVEDRLAAEIAPIFVPESGALVERDDTIRPQQSMADLARLKPVFDRPHGSVTVGNACGVTDGACALVLADETWARAHFERTGRDARTLIAVSGWATAGVDPRRMGLGPTAALPEALDRAGWTLGDLALLEINEAFAAQVLACIRVMADDELMARHAGGRAAVGEIDPAALNVNGGAIALGHPVGVSGARLVLTLALEMNRRGADKAAATLCVGGGQGQAVLLSRARAPRRTSA